MDDTNFCGAQREAFYGPDKPPVVTIYIKGIDTAARDALPHGSTDHTIVDSQMSLYIDYLDRGLAAQGLLVVRDAERDTTVQLSYVGGPFILNFASFWEWFLV